MATNPDGTSIELLRVKIRKAMPKPALVRRPMQGSDAVHAIKGTRKVAWGSSKGEAQLYRWEALEPGNRITGCAVLEGANSTYFVPEGWTMVVDEFGNAKLNRARELAPPQSKETGAPHGIGTREPDSRHRIS
jgi:N-methylhydantoinase A/oxoprolinase/acetone carboxylase beta subunit